jgi:hypothetical protein
MVEQPLTDDLDDNITPTDPDSREHEQDAIEESNLMTEQSLTDDLDDNITPTDLDSNEYKQDAIEKGSLIAEQSLTDDLDDNITPTDLDSKEHEKEAIYKSYLMAVQALLDNLDDNITPTDLDSKKHESDMSEFLALLEDDFLRHEEAEHQFDEDKNRTLLDRIFAKLQTVGVALSSHIHWKRQSHHVENRM